MTASICGQTRDYRSTYAQGTRRGDYLGGLAIRRIGPAGGSRHMQTYTTHPSPLAHTLASLGDSPDGVARKVGHKVDGSPTAAPAPKTGNNRPRLCQAECVSLQFFGTAAGGEWLGRTGLPVVWGSGLDEKSPKAPGEICPEARSQASAPTAMRLLPLIKVRAGGEGGVVDLYWVCRLDPWDDRAALLQGERARVLRSLGRARSLVIRDGSEGRQASVSGEFLPQARHEGRQV